MISPVGDCVEGVLAVMVFTTSGTWLLGESGVLEKIVKLDS